MCGILFSKSSNKKITYNSFKKALEKQKWRGPDFMDISKENFGSWLGHVRLSILGLDKESNQPMTSSCGQFKIIYNGEIYNHQDIRNKLNLDCKTTSDTETIIEAFSKIGTNSFELLDGMFAFVIFDVRSGEWWAFRDRYGIKPLFIYNDGDQTIVSSETISIRNIIDCSVCEESIKEWEIIRRPIPGKTFFKTIEEVLPGSIIFNGKLVSKISSKPINLQNSYEEKDLFKILEDSIRMHELSEVENVCLLSGGIDSSIIAAVSDTNKTYSIGLIDNNEIKEAAETAELLSKDIFSLAIDKDKLINAWEYLINLRGEPLSVPNEGLIYLICSSMKDNEKVVLTGEGADELFFGYDRIFREASLNKNFGEEMFFEMYGYADKKKSCARLNDYLDNLRFGKDNIDFLEDYFLDVHLTGLLRRMDMSSMAASKEARVPFVSKKLIDYMYRQPKDIKISSTHSKIPLRNLCKKLGLQGPINRKKIGFSSTFNDGGRLEEYKYFRNISMEILGWS
tara:strand:- start:501 stop:2030 length:1530 start_codon:yes stop_codon:yes gene_type:complete